MKTVILSLSVPTDTLSHRLNRRIDLLKENGWSGPNATIGPRSHFNMVFVKRVRK